MEEVKYAGMTMFLWIVECSIVNQTGLQSLIVLENVRVTVIIFLIFSKGPPPWIGLRHAKNSHRSLCLVLLVG